MIQAFLAFRYQGVLRIDEILKKPDNMGWKCRKYIKWRDVHNVKTDARALYSFADGLIEEKKLEIDLYGQISGIFFNVQKWKIDKEKLAIDPPARKEWEKRDILFKAVQTNLALIPARLSQQRLESDGLSNLAVQILFYASELDAFFQAQNISSYPIEPIANTLIPAKEKEWAKILYSRFELVYRSVGVTPPGITNATQFLKEFLDDLGFCKVQFDQELAIPPRIEVQEQDAIVELIPLEKFKLFEVAVACGIIQVRLNKKHPFIKSVMVNGALTPNMEIFFKSYAKCMLRMGGSIDTLETFNSYLGIDLHSSNMSESTRL